MTTKPRLKYLDVYGQPRPLEYSELLALTRECQAEAAEMPPMTITKSADGAFNGEELATRVVQAVRSFVARKTSALEARIAALEAKQ